MAGVLALLNYAVSVLLSLIGITQSRADQITVNKILAVLTDPVVGLNALHGELATVLADLASVQGDVLALGAPQQSGSPVTLPTVPPTGYGGASTSDIAVAVWTYSLGGVDEPGEILRTLRRVTDVWSGAIGWPWASNPLILVQFDVTPDGNFPTSGGPPPVALADILPSDADVGAWLTRAYPTWTWAQDSDSGFWWTFSNFSDGAFWYVTVTDQEFDFIQHYRYTPSSGPPKRSTLGDLAQIEGLIPVQYS